MAFNSIYRDGLFAGKTIVVSGGGTGIGRATARELAALGATVVLCSRSPDHLAATRDEIVAAGGRATAEVCDVRDPGAVEAFFGAAVARYGPIDALINNAGGQFLAPAEEITPNGWRAVVETNLSGTFYMARAAFAHSLREHGGAIVNVVTEMWRGAPRMAHSGAARAGVVNLTQTLAIEWAQHGVRVNAVAPGIVDSSGLARYGGELAPVLAAFARDVPAGRMGTEREVAAAIIYLLSPAAAFISGETLRVDGVGSLYPLHGYRIPAHDPWPAFDPSLDADAEE